MSILGFDFHQFVGVQVESDDAEALRFFEAEYRPSVAPLLRSLNQVNLKWRRSNWPFVSGYQIQIHKFLARWSYKITLDGDNIEIDAMGNRTAVPMVHHMLLHPSLRYLCTKRDVLMLHSSAVVLKNKSLVFTGKGGAGKTTISSLILSHGGSEWSLHADDYVFLTEGPTSFSYLTRSHLYRDQMRWVPAIQSLLSPRERLHLEFFGRLREITNERLKWPLRVEPSRLWPNNTIAPQADLAAIIVLRRGNDDRIILERSDLTEPAIEELIEMNFFEVGHFIRLMQKAYGRTYIEGFLEEWKDRERSLLYQILQETPLYRMDIPPRESARGQYGEALVEILKPILDGG